MVAILLFGKKYFYYTPENISSFHEGFKYFLVLHNIWLKINRKMNTDIKKAKIYYVKKISMPNNVCGCANVNTYIIHSCDYICTY